MNFALIIDAIGDNSIKSYYIKNDEAFTLEDDKPCSHTHSINSNCFISTYNYPWLFENGYFLNWNNHKFDLPDLDLDLIFVVKERSLARDDGHYDGWCEVESLRKKYPKAKIVAFLKEIWVDAPYDYESPKHKARIEFLNECDSVITNRPELKEFQNLADKVDKQFNFVAQPHNIDYFYGRWGGDKDLAIWAYLPNPLDRRANTYEFTNYISKKYNIPVKYKPLGSGQKFDYLSLEEFINRWSSCLFHFNLDPIDYFPGKQAVHTASVGTINIGGVNDNHFLLYPETATCDTKILEDRFVEYLEDDDKRNQVIKSAWEKVNEIFGFTAVRKQIENIKY
tara:strand:+ start:1053 stop:2066 length:1014 start_codon:yes stop_codon:yes gene_type:complete